MLKASSQLCRIGITKQAVMKTWMKIIRPDIFRLFAVAPTFNALPPILFKGKPAPV